MKKFTYVPHKYYKDASEQFPPNLYPEEHEIIRILETYGTVTFHMEDGINMCRVAGAMNLVQQYWVKYSRNNCGYKGSNTSPPETPAAASYYELYYEMLGVVESIEED